MTNEELVKYTKRQQRALKEQQFDPGPVDGQRGLWTIKAENYRAQSFEPQLPTEVRPRVLALAVRHVGKLSKKIFNSLVNHTQLDKVHSWAYNSNFVTSLLHEVVPETDLRGSRVAELMCDPSWTQSLGGTPPQAGDVFGVYTSSTGKVGHCGFILEYPVGHPYFLTVEAAHGEHYWPGNDGYARVCMRRRLKSDAWCVKSFLP